MWYLLPAYSVITGGESVHSRGQGGEVGAAERRHLSGPGLSAAPIVTWLLDKFGPIQLSGLSNLMLAMTQIPMARNAAKDLGQAMRPPTAWQSTATLLFDMLRQRHGRRVRHRN